MIRRRTFLAGLSASAGLAAPRLGGGAERQVLRFVPQTDLASIDPIWTTAYVTRNHGHLVYDTLYALDESFTARPQMVAGHTVENDGREWRLTLRDGLKFHDGAPVLARDVAASIARWAQRDMFGQTVLAVSDAIEAVSDNTVRFRLKRPFPLLPQALGKAQTNMPCIMPERLALTDPAAQVSEVVGSGPYRFVAAERMLGARVVYEKFDGYVPRPEKPSFAAGGKIARVPRIEWVILPDPGTASAALAAGEVDWWEQPTIDLQAMLKRDPNVVVEILDHTGIIGDFRPNHLYPPFDNPAFRRAVLGAIDQRDCMTAVVGVDTALRRDRVGVFCPDTPLANDAGIEVLAAPRDYDKVKRDLDAAGYKGEKIVFLAATDLAPISAICQVVADQLHKAGIAVDYQAIDWGSVQARRATKKPPAEGGWNLFVAQGAGIDYFNPAGILPLRGNGEKAWFGWPTASKIEALRAAWFDAPDLDAQKALAREIQLQVWQDVPFIPLGQFFQATAYRKSLTGIVTGGFPIFWNVSKS